MIRKEIISIDVKNNLKDYDCRKSNNHDEKLSAIYMSVALNLIVMIDTPLVFLNHNWGQGFYLVIFCNTKLIIAASAI